jgi:predicted SnoaL-like aldol condensation-catalyzing enzyme
MKKILSLLATGILFVCVSCSDDKTEKTAGDTMSAEKKDNSMAEKNLAASRIVSDAFQTGDISKIDDAVAADFVDHTDQGDKNRDSLKAMIQMMHKEFPDMKTEVTRELADNDYVFSLMHWTGTSNGQMGMPKGPFDMKAIEVVRCKDGKGVEHWSYMQPADVMKMMAQMPAAGKMDDKMKSK